MDKKWIVKARVNGKELAALRRVASVISSGNLSLALRQLVGQADESLEKHGIYRQREEARNSPEAKAIEAKLLSLFAQADAERETKGTAKSKADADYATRYGGGGPQAKRADGPKETLVDDYSKRYGNN